MIVDILEYYVKYMVANTSTTHLKYWLLVNFKKYYLE